LKRRDFLFLSGTSLLLSKPASAETLTVHYHKDPPHFAHRQFIAPGNDAFPEEAMAATAAPPKPASTGATRFHEITGAVLQSEQLAKGVPYWVARLDPATGIDIYGNQGIAVADIDGDGRDEIYVCQPGGLPNRLFRWRNSVLEECSAEAGIDLLDDTASALFLDLRNSGAQDLVVLCPGGPELFLNDGRGRFRHVPDAFRFARPAAGAFTGMAAADYDRDGKVDLYLCCYSFFQSEAQYLYPVPYHDAQNGPPNFLFRNRLERDGTGHFEDVTVPSGIDQNNNRFSFAPAWCDYDGSGWPSLYVANDFGRNNLYRNREGKFEDVAAAAGVEDMGPGMSAAWFDENGDGWPDLYVSNMWTAPGQRVVRSQAFPHQSAEMREAYRRHTKGNSMYRNAGDGKFADAGAALGVENGRWAWSADAADFDNDGVPEIFVTCGMLSGPHKPDLMSFFWRQVVAKSPATAAASAAYEGGWNAINQFIREGYSWNGDEPNVFFARGQGSAAYRDASAESGGLDFAGDSRAFAMTDLDGDGCIDIVVKSRLGPQVRLFQNVAGQGKARIAFDLQGVKSNRDAIGAKIECSGQSRWLNAGSGYLSQHSKRVFFGLPDGGSTAKNVRITWPSGVVQELGDLEAGAVYRVVEGSATPQRRTAFRETGTFRSVPVAGADNLPRLHDTWFVEPIPLPDASLKGPGLVVFHGSEKPTGLPAAVATLVDLRSDPERAAAYSLFRRYLFEYRAAELELPLALLLDAKGHARKIYANLPSDAQLRADMQAAAKPWPYAGRSLRPARRDFYKVGAALLWSGYPDYSLPYLESAVAQQPANARMWMLIGRVHLQKNRIEPAESALRRAIELEPGLADAWNELGGVAAARSAYADALQHYEKALSIQSDLVYCLMNAGQASDKLSRQVAAERYFRRAWALDPASPEAANALGLSLAKQGKSAEAKQRLQDAIRLKPDFGAAINNLGVLYMQQGQSQDAIAAFRYGIGKSPKEEILYLNLARLYMQAGNRDAARQLMRDLLAAVPNSAVAQKALRDLGEN
jgi:tetratricopeptide (TPR) repeat protein